MRVRRAVGIAAAAGAVAAGVSWLWRHQGELIMGRPLNEWAFTHMNLLLPTETVKRAPRASALRMAANPQQFADFRYEFAGEHYGLDELHRRTHTTGFIVLHRGEVLHENYPGRFASASSRFQLFSLTKSVTSMLVGMALERGEIASLDERVEHYLPQLADSAYAEVTIEQLLNMTSGVGSVEDWTIPDAPIRRFESAVTSGGSVLDVIRSTPRVRAAGTAFNYSTLDTHVIGWVLEAATGMSLAQYAEQRLWGQMSAEHDAFYFLSRSKPRTALGGGSLNATVRDVARIGAIMAAGGRVGGEQLVPADWVQRSRGSALPHLQVGNLESGGASHYGYSNQWWTLGGERRAFTGLGVHGQFLWVDPDSETVIVKTSAWNDEDDDERDRETCAALAALVLAVEDSASVAPRNDRR